METIFAIIKVVGIVEALLFLGGVIWAVFMWAKGVTPALLRLGNGLAKRRIAIFAKGDNRESLRNLLLDSKLFRAKNILEITKTEDIGRAKGATVYLVHWHDWFDHIGQVLEQKPDQCSLVVYAPYDLGRIPDQQMKNLDSKRHTSVTNFRGRLLNDIVASMITTSYER